MKPSPRITPNSLVLDLLIDEIKTSKRTQRKLLAVEKRLAAMTEQVATIQNTLLRERR